MLIQIDLSAQDIKSVRGGLFIALLILALVVWHVLLKDYKYVYEYLNGNIIILPSLMIYIFLTVVVFCIFIFFTLLFLETNFEIFAVNRFWRQCTSKKPLPEILKVFFEQHNDNNFLVIRLHNDNWHYSPNILMSINTLTQYFLINKDGTVYLKNPNLIFYE